MEGGGEGMVAIVQGLHDAGLAVTLLDGRYSYLPEQGHASAPYLGHNSPLALPQAHSSVETSTEIHKTSTSTQICDGRYASVYQTTHCSVVPTSPPVHLPEFPPQRAEPCRTQGNFEIGGSGRLDTYSPDRGLILDRRSSRAIESDSFAHSLRRYSLSSPQRTTSTELVERILSYTQAKHTPKSSRLSRSLRCLREKNLQTPQSPQISPNPSKNLPTCSRVSKHDVTKDVTNKWARNVSSLDKMKNYAMALPKTYRVTKYKDHQLNCTYDYLKSTDPPKLKPVRSTEVRYLSDMTKYLRDTLRQFVDDKPTVCPRIRSRYSQHRRSCHAAQPTTSSDSNNMQIQASLPQAPTVSRSTTTPKCIPNCPKRQKVCPSCRQFLPCECKAKSLEEIKNRRHIEEIVRQWAEEIPVYANECPADKLKRECLARYLVDKVDIPRDDYDYDRKVRDEIQKCLDVMPMWNPGTEIEKDRFKNDLNDKLFNKLKGLQKDKFEREVSRWVDELPFDDSVTDKDRIKENIVNRLKQIALNRPLSDIDYRNALIDEEMDILHELPLRSADEEILRVLAENLADRLVGIPSYEIKQKPRMSYDSGEFERKGMRKISNLRPSDDSVMDEVVDNILIDKLVAKLDALDLTGFDLDDENFQDELRDTIEAWLDAAIERGDVYVDPENREEVLDILMGKLLNTGDPAVKERLERARLNEEKRRALEKLASSGGKDGNIGDIEDQEIGKSKGGRYGDSKKDKTRDGRSDNDDYSKNGKSRNGHSDYNGNKRSRMSDGGSFDDSSQDKSKGGRYDKTKDGRSGDKTTQDKMTDDDEKKQKYKKKISDEVSQFCDDYLKRYPGTPLDSAILNQELYKALQKVPLPTDDTMAQEVEELRMKDEINEWMNEIPFKDKSRPQQLHRNKMVPVLARRLHEIEMEKEENPGLDSDGKMQYEISRWLRKLPLQPDEGDIDITTDKLIEKLKRTESERKFFPSFRTQGKQSIDSTGNVIGAGFGFEPGIGFRNGMGADPMCPYFKTILDKRCDNACMTKPQIPPSTLSAQDRAHLERIRQRNAARNRSPCCACKDASVNPPPIDAGIQTDIGVDPQWPPKENVRLSQTTGVQLSPQPSEPNAIQQSSSAEAACGSCNQVSPQVIIKEYYWDSADTSKLQAAGFVPGSSQIPYDTQQQRVPCLSQQTPCTRSQSFLPQNRSFPTRPEFMIQSPLSCSNRQSPCSIPKSPCVSQHRMPSRNMPYTSTPKRTGLRPNRSQQFRQPCFAKPDLSQTPSCIESDYQDAGASRSPQPKVTRLGSFDNVPAEYHQMPNGTRDELNWSSIRLPSDNEDFMGTSYGRHRVCMPSDDELDESCVRERRQDKMRCRCKDTHTRSSARIRVSHRPSCQSCTDSSVRRCPKCCGTHCPYPSYLYFRQ